MRQIDKQNGAWRSYQGYRNAGWFSGLLRLDKSRPRVFFVQQTQNEGLMLPVYLKEGLELPQVYREGNPIKVYSRLMGNYNAEFNRIEVRATALDFDSPGISEMPLETEWNRALPEGMEESAFIPTMFGKNDNVTKIVTRDRCNTVEIAGHVCGFMMERERTLENGRVIPRRLFIFIQQTGDVFRSIPVRYKGKNIMSLKDNIKVGTPVFIRAKLRVKHYPLPGSMPDPETGMIKTFQYIFLDGQAANQNEPAVATRGDHMPELTNVPQWARELWTSGEDAVRNALRKSVEARRVNVEQQVAKPQVAVSDSDLESAGI